MTTPRAAAETRAAAKDEDADELNLELPKYLKPLGMKVSATDAGTRGIPHITHHPARQSLAKSSTLPSHAQGLPERH